MPLPARPAADCIMIHPDFPLGGFKAAREGPARVPATRPTAASVVAGAAKTTDAVSAVGVLRRRRTSSQRQSYQRALCSRPPH
jgi:hypothetical protein